MGEKSNRLWTFADRITIADFFVRLLSAKGIAGLIGSVAIAIGARLEGVPWSAVAVFVLFAFGTIIWIWNSLTKNGPAQQMSTIQPVPLIIPKAAERPASGMTPLGLQFFVGEWRVGHGSASTGVFTITVRADRTASKSNVPTTTGTWDYANGEARIQWDKKDRWRDILRCTPDGVIKLAYDESAGSRLDSNPSNCSQAEKVVAVQG